MNNKILLIGGFHEAIELCESESIQLIGIIDNYKTGTYLGYKIFGNDDNAAEIYNAFSNVPVFITPDSPQKRSRLSQIYGDLGFGFSNLISSNSLISKSADIGKGVFIQSKVNISSFVRVGNFTRLNTMANIMHDTTIGDYCTIAPNAVILGNVDIGSHSYIGANATILPHLSIGSNVIIGAGAVVTKSIPSGVIMVGNPARELVAS